MKHLLVVLCISLMATGLLVAQNPLNKGGKQLNAGVGLSGWGVPIYFGMDFGIHPDISIGFEGSFRHYRDRWYHDYYYHNIFGVAAVGNYHFNRLLKIPPKFNFYAGLNSGFYVWVSDSDYDGDNHSGIGIGAQVGGRIYLTNNFALNAEVGSGNSFSSGKFGITYRF